MDTKVITWQDLANRYGVGESNARKTIREIKSFFPHGGRAPKGKIMTWELEAWESAQADLAFEQIFRKRNQL